MVLTEALISRRWSSGRREMAALNRLASSTCNLYPLTISSASKLAAAWISPRSSRLSALGLLVMSCRRSFIQPMFSAALSASAISLAAFSLAISVVWGLLMMFCNVSLPSALISYGLALRTLISIAGAGAPGVAVSGRGFPSDKMRALAFAVSVVYSLLMMFCKICLSASVSSAGSLFKTERSIGGGRLSAFEALFSSVFVSSALFSSTFSGCGAGAEVFSRTLLFKLVSSTRSLFSSTRALLSSDFCMISANEAFCSSLSVSSAAFRASA